MPLPRLRVRLTAAFAGVVAVVLALLATIAVLAARDRQHERLDHRVQRTVLAADGYAYPEGTPSRLVVDRQAGGYFGPRRRPGSPVLVIDTRGRLVAGPRLLDAGARKRALERAQRDQAGVYSDTAGGEDSRLAISPVFGDAGVLAAIVAAEPRAAADAGEPVLPIVAAAVALWLVTVAVAWLLIGRALAPAAAVARREEAFLADAAHELRTPVAVIRARAEQALHEQGADAPAAGALRAIGDAAERASGTIADMLELARLDARRGRIEREPLRLDLLLEQLIDEYRDDAERSGARLELRESPEAIVHGDERLLRRAIANLVENAIRYGAVGGEIVVALERDDAHLRVTVADRGPGVPPAQRAAIFDRFHRASAAAGGSGLGLPIARLTVEAHDGEVALLASDDEHPGATFVITLPLS